ncbi:unnamed protein product, partial [Prorocentrum cordatum]
MAPAQVRPLLVLVGLLVLYAMFLFRDVRFDPVPPPLPLAALTALGSLDAPAAAGSSALALMAPDGLFQVGDWVQIGAPSEPEKELQAVANIAPGAVGLASTLFFSYPAGTPVFRVLPQAINQSLLSSISQALPAGVSLPPQLPPSTFSATTTSALATSALATSPPPPTTSSATTTPTPPPVNALTPPPDETLPTLAPVPTVSSDVACSQECTLDGNAGMCKDLVADLARGPLYASSGPWEACESALETVLEECPECQGCSHEEACEEQVFAPTGAPGACTARARASGRGGTPRWRRPRLRPELPHAGRGARDVPGEHHVSSQECRPGPRPLRRGLRSCGTSMRRVQRVQPGARRWVRRGEAGPGPVQLQRPQHVADH